METSQALTLQLREATLALHKTAERCGIVKDMLRGQSTLAAYTLYLGNLAPVYKALEDALLQNANKPAFNGLVNKEMFRYQSIISDLSALLGEDWQSLITPLNSSCQYVDRIGQTGQSEGGELISHLYVRYFGDLNGGQILSRLLSKTLNLSTTQLSFYQFPEVHDLAAFKQQLKRDVDSAEKHLGQNNANLLKEAQRAFQFNIDLSVEVKLVAETPTARAYN